MEPTPQKGRPIVNWRKLYLVALLLPVLVLPLRAQEKRPFNKKWLLSAAALVAANALDAHSSRGLYEANPLLRSPDGTFNTGRASAIKFGTSGAFLLVQALLMRNHDAGFAKPFTIANTVFAGVVAGTAVRNYSIRQSARPDYLVAAPVQ